MRAALFFLCAVALEAASLDVPAAIAQGSGTPVDSAVVLAADVSRSIDDGEFQLQRRGYGEAVQSQRLLDTISTGPHGAIALAYVEWAGDREQRLVVGWKIIRSAADAGDFASALSAAPRSFIGRTAIGSAIDFCASLFARGAVSADRKVIDVSGDGTSNQGLPVAPARDAAVRAGFVINGLAIRNRRAEALGGYLALHTNPPGGGIAQYYRDNVIGGAGAFVIPVEGFGAFGDALLKKLIDEVAAIPKRGPG